MGENSSIVQPKTSNFSSHDSTIQETIDSQVDLVPKNTIHELNSSTSLDQINHSHVQQEHESASNTETQITKSTNLHNPMQILETPSHIESIEAFKDERVVGFAGNPEMNEKREFKKEKRLRRKGKGSKKQLNVGDFERQTVCDCDKRGDRARVVYARAEMEALRFLGLEEQKKKWVEVYCGLGPVVAEEYDALSGSGHDEKGNYVNFDPRIAKNKGGDADFVGKESNGLGSELENLNQLDHVTDIDLDVAEDYNEDEDSDYEYVTIQRPAFRVTGEPDFDSGPPQDGLEYLRRVRWEAEHIPKVKVSKVEKNVLIKEQTVYMPKIPDIASCPEHLMPSKEWEDVFLADFSQLRLALSSKTESDPLPDSIDESMIQENLDSCQTDDDPGVVQENLDFCQIDDWPSLHAVLGMEPVARATMLRKRITALEAVSHLGRADCAWLFALCAAIDAPFDADTSASVRCLLRKCASLRAERSELDDEVIMLNILVTISGKYFGQSETG